MRTATRERVRCSKCHKTLACSCPNCAHACPCECDGCRCCGKEPEAVESWG